MRAGVIAAVLVGACGGADLDPAIAPDAAALVDAAPPVDAAALAVVPTAWMVELEETALVESGVVVPGGFVVVGSREIFRFTDDGELTVRRDLPEDWIRVWGRDAAGGDVLLIVDTPSPAISTRLVRLDGATLDERWSYEIAAGITSDASPVGLADGRTIVVARDFDGPSNRPWRLHEIASTGVGSARPLDIPRGITSALLELADASIVGGFGNGDGCFRWTLDLEAATGRFTPIDAPGCQHVDTFVSSGVQLMRYQRDDLVEPRRMLMIVDRQGAVVVGPVETTAYMVSPGAMVHDGRIASLASGRLYTAPLDDLDPIVTRTLPFRPGGFSAGSVMASDGPRTFVAWLDQVSTFDTVLRVARLGAL